LVRMPRLMAVISEPKVVSMVFAFTYMSPNP